MIHLNNHTFCFSQIAALVIDSMHLKQHVEYDQGLKQAHGSMCVNNLAEEDDEQVAEETLLSVGLRSHWKIQVTYYSIYDITASLQAGIKGYE